MVTAKHKSQKLIFNPPNQTFVNFLDELQKLVKQATRTAARTIVDFFETDQNADKPEEIDISGSFEGMAQMKKLPHTSIRNKN